MTTPNNTSRAITNLRAHHDDNVNDRLLTEKEVAARQGRSVKTLQNQRLTGGGIPYLKLGRSVRYRLGEVVAWEEAGRCASTSSEARHHG